MFVAGIIDSKGIFTVTEKKIILKKQPQKWFKAIRKSYIHHKEII